MVITFVPTLLIFYVVSSFTKAQQQGNLTEEGNPTITLRECTLGNGCTSREAKITLDANWRWIHLANSETECFTGNTWDWQYCSDPVKCAQACVLEGVSSDEYRETYGIEEFDNGIKLNFVTNTEYGMNIGSRVYLMDDGVNGDKYKLFYLKNREMSFDVDVSELPCGMNSALYLSEMDADGGKGLGNNNAGAKYGTGYCDAQCPHDIKFIHGEANVINWNTHGVGFGKYGSCCSELDIWEANSMANSFTPHPCITTGHFRCEGVDCGDYSTLERYDGVCDKDGCDFNPFRMGNPNFYGRGTQFKVDTTRPMKVVTQFLTTDGTDDGDLFEIRRFYVQDGIKIESPFSTILDNDDNVDSMTDQYCDAAKNVFEDVKDFLDLGGMKGMGESLDRGHVMVFSLWDDGNIHMKWLDSAFPLDEPRTDPGITRGSCDGGIESSPTFLREYHPDASATFTNIAVGDIGSTYEESFKAQNVLTQFS